jgi:hypothetical protein
MRERSVASAELRKPEVPSVSPDSALEEEGFEPVCFRARACLTIQFPTHPNREFFAA